VPLVTFRNPFERTSQPLHTVAVIPARYHSTRFPAKPLADLAGRPMIEHVFSRAASAPGVDAVIVATDDARIEQAVRAFGGIVRMTSPLHSTGLDRVAEVAADLTCEIVVNVQGDEPLIDPRAIADVVAPFARDPALQMTTLRRRISDPAELDNPHVVKIVVDRRDRALYFSRAAVPFARDPRQPIFKHIGLYAYRRAFVQTLAALPRTPLELAESLEQLRALEHGFGICAVETDYDSIGVDTPEDLERVRRQLTVGARI
jgi:3-deoxy-manno-octulosonate cytidylyltransferase (CMP-KDO synthetase)